MNNTSEQSTLKKTTKKNKYFLFIFLTAFSILLALAATFLSIYSYRLLNQHKTWMLQEQKNALSQMQQQLTMQLKQSESYLNQLITKNINVSEEQAKSQADALIHLAQFNLRYSNNIDTALQLLQLAKEQISSFHSLEMKALSQKLTTDIQTLQQLPRVNSVQLLAALDKLILQIKFIPLIPNTPTQPFTSLATTPANSWWDKIKNSLVQLKSFVVIRKIENPTAYAFSPDERLLLKQTVLVKLSLAEWAVVNKQQDQYQESLQATKAMLATLRIPPDLATELNQTIDKLLLVSLAPKINEELNSLQTKPPVSENTN